MIIKVQLIFSIKNLQQKQHVAFNYLVWKYQRPLIPNTLPNKDQTTLGSFWTSSEYCGLVFHFGSLLCRIKITMDLPLKIH